MNPSNLVSASLTQQDIADVRAALATIRAKLPFLVNLTPVDRRRLVKMGDGSRAFVETALQAVQSNPQLLPASYPTQEFANDWSLREQMLPLNAEVQQLAEAFDDTLMALGSDLMGAAIGAYGYLQRDQSAAADVLRAALAARFKKSGAAAPTPAATAQK